MAQTIRLVRDLPQDEPSWEELIHQLDLATIEATQADQRRKALQQVVVDRLEAAKSKSMTVGNPLDDTEELRVVYVTNNRVSVDSGKVRSVLGRSYSKVRSDDVDREKLDSYINEVDEATKEKLSECISIKHYNPYVRLSHVRKGDG